VVVPVWVVVSQHNTELVDEVRLTLRVNPFPGRSSCRIGYAEILYDFLFFITNALDELPPNPVVTYAGSWGNQQSRKILTDRWVDGSSICGAYQDFGTGVPHGFVEVVDAVRDGGCVAGGAVLIDQIDLQVIPAEFGPGVVANAHTSKSYVDEIERRLWDHLDLLGRVCVP